MKIKIAPNLNEVTLEKNVVSTKFNGMTISYTMPEDKYLEKNPLEVNPNFGFLRTCLIITTNGRASWLSGTPRQTSYCTERNNAMILENAHRFASENVGRDENGNYEKGYFEWYVNFYSAILSYESEHRHEGTLEERAKNYADKRIKTISQERYSVIGSSTYQDLQSWYKDIVNETFNSNMKTSYKVRKLERQKQELQKLNK